MKRLISSKPSFNSIFSRLHFSSSNKISKILIANRGEIARRVIQTSKKLNIQTVAVYSDADRHSMFVRQADQAYHIGAAPSSQSYLRIDRIVDVIKKTRANGVHPGYGFLSQNPLFQKAVQDAGAKFIGPPEKAIIAMGDKIQSKKLARQANVSTVPGFLGTVERPQEIKRISNQIGYPVMIKASAGGGGKGMRIAWNDDQAIQGFKLSKEEAKSSFGDDRIFIQKYIQEPRHIEFQILGDKYGNYVYLPQRECSVQRRNQKVIEQAPSPLMNEETRKKMGQQAIQLASKCGYYSTGTVQFLVDKNLDFYFLEMNTRLQVEHPITEQVTGIDLVEQMIRIAEGDKLPMKQSDVKINGHSLQYRVYAEDPAKKFLPSIGFLKRYVEPSTFASLQGQKTQRRNVRIDTGVEEGSQISMYYDPMISKLVTHQKNRKDALDLMNKIVDDYVITGVNHNLAFCKAIINNQDFYNGNYNTNFIPKYFKDGYFGRELLKQEEACIGLCAHALKSWVQKTILKVENQKESHNSEMAWVVLKKAGVHVSVNAKGNDKYELKVISEKTNAEEEKAMSVEYDIRVHPEKSIVTLNSGGSEKYKFQYSLNNNDPCSLDITYEGISHSVEVYSQSEKNLLKYMAPVKEIDLTKTIVSPMPGTVVSVNVQKGQHVMAGQTIVILEAMKMQNVIKAENDGVVKTVNAVEQKSVRVDEILVQFQ